MICAVVSMMMVAIVADALPGMGERHTARGAPNQSWNAAWMVESVTRPRSLDR